MPATKRPKPLYQRGPYALHSRAGRNLEIVWYDAERKRERSLSAGTADVGEGQAALDRHYLTRSGARLCPTCHRPWDSDGAPSLATVIADYLTLSEGKAGAQSAGTRLAHVVGYLAEQQPNATVADADEAWIERFRQWLLAKPVVRGGASKPRALGSVEGSVLQLAAAINAVPGQRAGFRPIAMTEVAKSPVYRADVPMLAAMFSYAMATPKRANLLRYLRFAVATWARPEAIFDARPVQWHAQAGVFDLNPPNRRQTKKYRPKVPIARQFAPLLSDPASYLTVVSVRRAWDTMRNDLGLPADGEAYVKLIRRSMATLARRRIGEANWRQGEMMLGHVKASISDIYAVPDPANLGLALAATESIIDDIEKLAPGSFNGRGKRAVSLADVA